MVLSMEEWQTIVQEFPKFDGVDPVSWIARAQKIFEVHRLRDLDKLQLASLSMDGEKATNWFYCCCYQDLDLTWNRFISLLLQRFGYGYRANVYKRLNTLRQSSTVDAYVREFEAVVAHVPCLSEERLLECFRWGLKLMVRHRLHSFRPTTLLRAMEIAREIDAEFSLAEEQSLAPEASLPPPSHTEGETVASISVEEEGILKEDSSEDVLKEDSSNQHVALTSEISNESKQDTTFPLEGLQEDAANMPHISSIQLFGSTISRVDAPLSMAVNAIMIEKFGNASVSKHPGTQLTMGFVDKDDHSTRRGEPSMQMQLWVLNVLSQRPPPMPPDMDTWTVAVLALHSVCRLQWDPGGEVWIYYATSNLEDKVDFRGEYC